MKLQVPIPLGHENQVHKEQESYRVAGPGLLQLEQHCLLSSCLEFLVQDSIITQTSMMKMQLLALEDSQATANFAVHLKSQVRHQKYAPAKVKLSLVLRDV